MEREEDRRDRKRNAFWAAVQGFPFEAVHNLMGSKSTDREVQEIIERAKLYRLLRDKILGTPWHKLGQSVEIIINLKKVFIKDKD